MSALSDIVNVTITATTRSVTQAGFNVPLIWSYHTRFVEAYREYSEVSDMLADGFTSDDPAYKMALALCSQDNRPETFIVGRATSGYTWGGEIVITSATQGDHVKFRVIGSNGLDSEIDYTIGAAATTTTVATAVELLVEALTGLASTSAVATISITADAPNVMFWIVPAEGETDLLNCTFRDTTADANYGDQIGTFDLTNSDWYCVLSELRSSANVQDVAAAIEALPRIYIAGNSDTQELNTSTDVLGPALLAAAYDRTALKWSRYGHMYADCAYVGTRLAYQPGEATWKFANPSGVTADVFTATQRSALEGSNTNYLHTVGGLNIIAEGKMASGEWIDNTILIDWLTARIQERVLGVLATALKVPYTDKGADSLAAEVLAQLREGEDIGGLVADSSYVRAPRVSTMSTAFRAARQYGPIQFGADIAGAIHTVSLRGTLSV